jgi:ketosteroid isomerase-like protein
MDKQRVSEWLDAYVDAWRSYDRAKIAGLFAEDAEYRYHPYDDPVRGRDAIVESWLEDPDEPGTYDGRYEPVAVDGDVAVAVGASTYRNAGGAVDRIYDNVYVMRFDGDGRCREFTEWYIKRPGLGPDVGMR